MSNIICVNSRVTSGHRQFVTLTGTDTYARRPVLRRALVVHVMYTVNSARAAFGHELLEFVSLTVGALTRVHRTL